MNGAERQHAGRGGARPGPVRRHRRGACALALVAVALAPARLAGAAGDEVDLLGALARALVCADGADGCRRAAAPRGAEDGGRRAGVRLAGGAETRVHVRLPACAALTLEFARAEAGLAVEVVPRAGAPHVVYRAARTQEGGPWETARIDLGRFGAAVVRLGLRPLEDDARGLFVRRATLAGRCPEARPAPGPREPRLAAGPPNVVVYVIDTLRADHLGCYGYARSTTPRIDALAETTVLFEHAVAQSSWTLPATASILTGVLPHRHGAVTPEHAIRPEVPTLAEWLRRHGWTTAAFVTNYLGSAIYGHGRGFDTFRFYPEQGGRRRSVYLRSDALVRRVLRWLAHGPREPFFLYVHATDPHFPYVPPARYARALLPRHPSAAAVTAALGTAAPFHNGRDAWGTRPAPLAEDAVALLRDLYDAEIRLADEQLGRLLDALRERDLLDRSVIVLTSDHGEEFLEHGGVAHGQTLHAEALGVPLLVRPPGGIPGGRRATRIAQHVDLAPTVLALAGVPAPPGLDGVALLEPAPDGREAHASLRLAGRALDALVDRDWVVIRDADRPRGSRFAAYLTGADPRERWDRAAEEPVLVGYARDRLAPARVEDTPAPVIPPAELERLMALGYLVD